jgi:ATP-dependent Clp protease ATP-binding subunit ClpA
MHPGEGLGRKEGPLIFNRFAKEARRCVEAALEEARELGHDSVGDEDLLLGILRVGEGMAAEALSSLGVTLEDAREESEAMLAEALSTIGISLEEVRREAGEAFEMRIPDDRRIPFAPRAKKALEQALREALRLGDNRISGEHVLLGVLRDEDGMAVRLLGNLGVAPASLEERLDQLRDRAA